MLDASLPTLAGQVLWLDAADTATILDAEGDNAASGAFSGAVSTWVDKSTSGFNVTAVAGQTPDYGLSTLNGKGVMSFNGTTDRMANAGATVGGNDYTAFFVFNRTTGAARDAVFEMGGGGSRNGVFINDSGNSRINIYANGSFSSLAPVYTPGTNTLLTVIHDVTSINAWNAASNQLSAVTSARAATTGLYVGDDSTSGDQLQGTIAEIIVYDRDLTALERHDVENYLATKWGLTVTNTDPVNGTNTGNTLDQGTAENITSAMLSSTDADNTAASLVYTVTDVVDHGTLVNTNTGLTLGLSDTFLQSDIDNNYIQYTHDGSANFADAFGFTVSDQYGSTAAGTFNLTITPVNHAPVIEGWTSVSFEDFEAGATGWSDNTTETSNPYLTRFLGRHSLEGGAQNTYKTYALSGTQDYAVISFDMYEIDSWDGETFRIFIDDVMVYSSAFSQSTFEAPASGSSGSVSWTVQRETPFNANYAFGGWVEQNYHYTLTIDTSLANVKLGFSSTLNQAISDEAWGVDNVAVYEVGSGGVPGAFSVVETAPNGTVVGTVTATDQDVGDSLTYAITGGTGAAIFSINPTTGVVTLTNTAAVDYETLTSYTLTVQVTDDGTPTLSDTETLTVNILNMPENTAPTIPATGPFSVAENATVGTAVGTVTATDPESQTITYSITAGNTGNVFAINPSTGAITISSTTNLNYEATPSYNLTITARDNGFGTLAGTRVVTVNITNINEAPIFDPVNGILATNPGVSYNAATGNFYRYVSTGANYAAASAAASGSMITGVAGHLATITSAPENTYVRGLISGSAWIGGSDSGVEGQWVWGAGGAEAGQMFWLGAAGGSVQNGLYANWSAGEPNNSGNEDALQILTSGFWNDGNTGTSIGYVIEWEGASILPALQNGPYSIAENSAAGTSVGYVHSLDPDAADTRTYSITGGTGAALFAVNPTTGQITLTGSVNYEATASYTLNMRVQDAGGLFDTVTVTVNVSDVNETPTLNPAGPFSFNENVAGGTAVTTMTATDPDTADTLTYSIQSGNTGGMFSINPTTGALTFAGSPNFEAVNAYSLVIRVTDNGTGNLYAEQTVAVSINDLNETPVLAAAGPFAINENVAIGTAVTTMIATDQDTADTLTYSIQSGNTGGMFSINPTTGALTFAGSPNFEAVNAYSLVIRVTDNGTGSLYAERTVNISITDVNEAPELILLSYDRVTENDPAATLVGMLSSIDQDTADVHTYSLISNPGTKFQIVGNELRTAGDIDYELNQSFTLVIRSDDGHGGTRDQSFLISVNDLQDTFTAPPDSPPPSLPVSPFGASASEGNSGSPSLIMSSLRGGEAGQMLAFYGMGDFHQIIRENITFGIRSLYSGEGESEAGWLGLDAGYEGQDVEIDGNQEENILPDRFTNLRQALAFYEQLRDAEEGTDQKEGAVENTRDDVSEPERGIPANTLDRQFVDVLTYHQQRQAKLREALKG